MGKILVIGAGGQIGTDLTLELEKEFGKTKIIASDLSSIPAPLLINSNYLSIDVLDKSQLRQSIIENDISEVYLLAALLSATGEKNPEFAWKLNMEGLLNVLNLGKEGLIKKIFWPSSIAVFGGSTPKERTPQQTIMEPSTVYGISKLAGEQWCQYYHSKYGVDVRSLRYPGLISYSSLPGGGTTDYAVEIFYYALLNKPYCSYLKENTCLPMMFMQDAIQATIQLMKAPEKNITIRTSYNLAGVSCTPGMIFQEIKKHEPSFEINYSPDFRQEIADSWPNSIDDTKALKDWGWKNTFDLKKIVQTMLEKVDPTKLI